MSEDNEKFNDEKNRPVTPTNDDCCGNSCNPCVFDVHKRLLKQWEKGKFRSGGMREKNFLSPLSYKKFVVKDIVNAGEDFVKIQLDCSKEINGDSRIFFQPGQHVILSTNKISRPYTPISWTRHSLNFLIKFYSNGAMSNFLKKLEIADEIRVRGPYGDFTYKSNSFRDVVAFCIGSGIAAIYPIARSIVDDENDETRFHLVAGFRKLAEIPLKNELRELSDYWNVNCTLEISNLERNEIIPNGIDVKRGKLDEMKFHRFLENHSPENTLILICGTREFNDTLERWTKDRNFPNYHIFE